LGKDILGSVRSVSNETGTLESRYEYDAFGKPYTGDFSGGMNLGYTGKPYDSATGLYNYGYRDYKPEVARFTTVDPIRDGNNWFAYVNNDPVNWIDLFGLEKKTFANGENEMSSTGTLSDGTNYKITISVVNNSKYDSLFRTGEDGDKIPDTTITSTTTYNNLDGSTGTYTKTTSQKNDDDANSYAAAYGVGQDNNLPKGVTMNAVTEIKVDVTITETEEKVSVTFNTSPSAEACGK
jgi:RHS repeat-associated protein